MTMDTNTFHDILIFMHLGKTAGSTLKRALLPQFSSSDRLEVMRGRQDALGLYYLEDIQAAFVKDIGDSEAALKFLVGHLPFGTHTIFRRPARYISLVRDPVDRLVSQYYYLRSRDLSGRPVASALQRMSLLDYVSSHMSPDGYDGQTRALAGMFCREHIDGTNIDFPPTTEAHWAQALENIERHFLFVAPHDEVDSAICIVARLFGFSIESACAPFDNVTPNKPLGAIGTKVRRIAAEHNVFDQRLVEHARTTFRAFTQALPYDLAADVAALRALRNVKYAT
jgi:Galactose-3-O-sulfotransferase